VQPAAVVAVTVYVDGEERVATTDAPVVALRPVEGDQAYVDPPEAVSVMLVPQITAGLGEIAVRGKEFAVAVAVAEQDPVVPVTV
jgi:hypothetical protein